MLLRNNCKGHLAAKVRQRRYFVLTRALVAGVARYNLMYYKEHNPEAWPKRTFQFSADSAVTNLGDIIEIAFDATVKMYVATRVPNRRSKSTAKLCPPPPPPPQPPPPRRHQKTNMCSYFRLVSPVLLCSCGCSCPKTSPEKKNEIQQHWEHRRKRRQHGNQSRGDIRVGTAPSMVSGLEGCSEFDESATSNEFQFPPPQLGHALQSTGREREDPYREYYSFS